MSNEFRILMIERICLAMAFGLPAVVAAWWLVYSPMRSSTGETHKVSAEMTRPLPEATSIINRLSAGEIAYVDLDACPFDDAGYDPTGDFLGVLMCGETYSVKFNADAQTWTVSGPDERASELHGELRGKTHTGSGTHPRHFRLTLWGVGLSFRENGEVFKLPDTPVGHIRFENVGP